MRDRICEFLNYNAETGKFTWIKAACSRFQPGSTVGRIDRDGYIIIGLDGYEFRAHRIAWLLTHGYMPECYIDHINGDPSDNRILNLRLANFSQNGMNAKAKKNSSGFKGVVWHKRDQKWIARIRVNRKPIHIGAFKNLEDAVEARNQREIELFGEYRRIEGQEVSP
jgi:hypothetical protein